MAALVHVVLFTVALPPFDLWFLAPLIPAPLAWMAMRARSSRSAVLIAFAAQLLMWLWLMRWIVPVTAVGYPFLALFLSIYGSLFVWIIRRIDRHRTLGRLPMTIVLPVIWVGIEFLRGDLIFNGYPWYFVAHPLITWPALAQSADLFGTYFISFIAATISGVIVDALRLQMRTERRAQVIRLACVILLIQLINIGYGAWRMKQVAPLTPGPTILAIQTSLPQDNKTHWGDQEKARDLAQFIDLTRHAFEQTTPKPDLIVWPETMLPSIGFERQTLDHLGELGPDVVQLVIWPGAVETLSRELNTPMLVGSEAWVDTSLVLDAAGSTRRLEPGFTYNSAYLIQGDPPYQRYDKFFLTPFGETMPYISNWPWLERQMLTIGVGAELAFNLDSNPEVRLLNLNWKGSSVALATPICFEDTVAHFCRRMAYDRGVKRTDIFVNISNDGWFNVSRADRKLHAQIARFRCIENRIPMVRCVNTGMSVVIDSAGRLLAAAGGEGYGVAKEAGWVASDVQLDSRHTLYGRVGEVWAWLCLAATAIGLGLSWTGRRSEQMEAET